MEQNSTSVRLHALDGIRGLAILLVVLNHINATYVAQLLPTWLSSILFGSGVTGVSLLFALSGFLMAYIYPNPESASYFLQKRYTRIFPLFVTSCILMLTLRNFSGLAWYWQIFFMLFFAVISYLIWQAIKRFASLQTKKYIFFGFIFLQIFAGSFYLFWVMRHPAIVFNQQISPVIREGTIGLVNATLTLPLGDYIPMLEGVYWSLVSEVLFYIIYPIICVPIVRYLQPQKRWIKIALLFALMPFFAGMDILSHKILVLSMLQLPICYYFVVGIVLGYLFKHHEKILMQTDKFFPRALSYVTVFFFIIVITVKLFVIASASTFLASWIHMIWAFPVIIVMALALNPKTPLSKILSSRIPVFFGTISYSIYLAHTPIIHLVNEIFIANSLFTNFLQLLVTFGLTVGISALWYQWLERPYFKRNKTKEEVKSYHPAFVMQYIRRPTFLFSAICIIYFFAIFNAYESNFNFFSSQASVTNIIFNTPQIKQEKLSMKQYPKINFTFTSSQDNFEILTMHLLHDPIPDTVDSPQWLVFRIKEIGQKDWYATDRFNLARIKDDAQQPFGFPIIPNAKGKSYLVELSLSNPKYPQYLTVDKISISGIYKVDKLSLLKHPVQMMQFVYAKILTVIIDNQARETFFLFLPLLVIIILIAPRKRFVYTA